MGKVRTELVKRTAKQLLEKFPDKFTTDFESNKKLVKSLTNIASPKLLNRVAGYTTRLVVITQDVQDVPVPESEEEETE